MLNEVNKWLTTAVTAAQTTLGLIAIVMLILMAIGVLYYVIARALMGIYPGLYAPVSGDWVKGTALTWIVGTACFGGLWGLITAAIRLGKYTGLGG